MYTHTIKEYAETNGHCESLDTINNVHRKCNNEQSWILDISGSNQNQNQWSNCLL